MQVVDHETAAGNDLLVPGSDQAQGALDQLRGDSVAAQRPRGFGMGDDDVAAGDAIVGEGEGIADIQFEAPLVRIVTDRAPAERSTRVQASVVAPLAQTSSTSTTASSRTRPSRLASPLIANAPATVLARARPPSPRSDSV